MKYFISGIILILALTGLIFARNVSAHYKYHCYNQDCIEIIPEISPEAEVTPTDVPSNQYGLPGDGKSDGRSDGLSSCPKCTQAPDAKSPYDGQVVGWK